jgi:outer membrane protein OmpA-like peptidoglycan-associated protein
VDVKLAALEQLWPDQRDHEATFSGPAREVIQLAHGARRISTERAGSAATTASLARAADDVETAQRQQGNAQLDAASARASADSAGEVTDSIRTAAAAAAAAAEQAAMVARQDQDAAWAGLASSISAVLDTKREARGLLVNLSGVYFTTGQAVLQPVARENLSKLSGIMLGYQGPYTLSIGGHTDAVGSDALNDQLSLARAESVRSYLIGAGIAESHLPRATGYGAHQPVADNATADGRAKNRRVEIIIHDPDLSVR